MTEIELYSDLFYVYIYQIIYHSHSHINVIIYPWNQTKQTNKKRYHTSINDVKSSDPKSG